MWVCDCKDRCSERSPGALWDVEISIVPLLENDKPCTQYHRSPGLIVIVGLSTETKSPREYSFNKVMNRNYDSPCINVCGYRISVLSNESRTTGVSFPSIKTQPIVFRAPNAAQKVEKQCSYKKPPKAHVSRLQIVPNLFRNQSRHPLPGSTTGLG